MHERLIQARNLIAKHCNHTRAHAGHLASLCDAHKLLDDVLRCAGKDDAAETIEKIVAHAQAESQAPAARQAIEEMKAAHAAAKERIVELETQANLVDQLQARIVELEQTNADLVDTVQELAEATPAESDANDQEGEAKDEGDPPADQPEVSEDPPADQPDEVEVKGKPKAKPKAKPRSKPKTDAKK